MIDFIFTAYEASSQHSSATSNQRLFIIDETQSNSSAMDRILRSANDRRRSFMNDRPKTAISGIVRSYSSSSFESPDEDSDSDWDEEVEINNEITSNDRDLNRDLNQNHTNSTATEEITLRISNEF